MNAPSVAQYSDDEKIGFDFIWADGTRSRVTVPCEEDENMIPLLAAVLDEIQNKKGVMCALHGTCLFIADALTTQIKDGGVDICTYPHHIHYPESDEKTGSWQDNIRGEMA
jgi:hypothetical protein